MMSMCPICFELYSDLWSKPCCNCESKTISLSVELIGVVQMFLNRGFIVVSASSMTHENQEGIGKNTHIRIDFETKYPDAIFYELPPGWIISEYHLVKSNQVLESELSMLGCVCRHPPSESDNLSIEFDKLLTISNLEVWLEGKDPEACKSILILAGYL